MSSPKAAVLTGYGINTDYEVAEAIKLSGAKPLRVHMKDLVENAEILRESQLLVIPGGFSFGDDISAGKILAKKLELNLKEELRDFVDRGKLILGICNGFQVLVKVGLLPDSNSWVQKSTLIHNRSGKFENRWVYLTVNGDSECVFTRGLERLYLPVRNGEGRFVPDTGIYEVLKRNRQVVLTYTDEVGEGTGYPYDPSGSVGNIAGICDEQGRIFGLMPHPEAYLFPFNHPRWTRIRPPSPGLGLRVFENAVNYIKEELL